MISWECRACFLFCAIHDRCRTFCKYRYVQDSLGRFVPAHKAAIQILAQGLELDDNRDLGSGTIAPCTLAPFAELAGVRRTTRQALRCSAAQSAADPTEQSAGTSPHRRSHRATGHRQPGKTLSQRVGGILRPILLAAAPSKSRKPAHRYVNQSLGRPHS